MGAGRRVNRAFASIEQLTFFELTNRFHHHIDGTGARSQLRLTDTQNICQGSAILSFLLGVHGAPSQSAGATVNGQDRSRTGNGCVSHF